MANTDTSEFRDLFLTNRDEYFKKYHVQYYKQNKGKYKQWKEKWKRNNPGRSAEYMREYHKKHREERNEYLQQEYVKKRYRDRQKHFYDNDRSYILFSLHFGRFVYIGYCRHNKWHIYRHSIASRNNKETSKVVKFIRDHGGITNPNFIFTIIKQYPNDIEIATVRRDKKEFIDCIPVYYRLNSYSIRKFNIQEPPSSL